MKDVRIYTTRVCPYCLMAKRLLDSRGIAYQEINVSDSDTRERIARESGWRTVPVIYIGDELVGGYNELADLDRAGRLLAMTGA